MTNKYELLVPVECRLAVDAFVDTARTLMEKHGELSPVAFVGRFTGGGTIVPGLANVSKDLARPIVQKLARKADADYVLFIDECWLKKMDYATLAEAREDVERRQRNGEQVRDMDGRIDAVLFQLETYAGMFDAIAVREPKDDAPGKYTFGAVKFEMSHESSGRFVGMLPPKGTKQ